MSDHLLLSTEDSGVTAPSRPLLAAASWNGSTRAPRGMPAVVPRDQLYYWTYIWQAGIRHSRKELAAGDFRDFDTPRDAIHWLLSDEDD
jgi:hypothetical protein